jgi:hypothetical protein
MSSVQYRTARRFSVAGWILQGTGYISGMCNLYTYKLSRDEIRGLLRH